MSVFHCRVRSAITEMTIRDSCLLQPTLNELNNGVINAAFLLLFKDLIRLFACYNDGIINLLGIVLSNLASRPSVRTLELLYLLLQRNTLT